MLFVLLCCFAEWVCNCLFMHLRFGGMLFLLCGRLCSCFCVRITYEHMCMVCLLWGGLLFLFAVLYCCVMFVRLLYKHNIWFDWVLLFELCFVYWVVLCVCLSAFCLGVCVL